MALSRSAFAGLDLWRLFSVMSKISYAGYRFPPEIIQQAIWLYVRFTLSFRDIDDFLAERGIMVSYSAFGVLQRNEKSTSVWLIVAVVNTAPGVDENRPVGSHDELASVSDVVGKYRRASAQSRCTLRPARG
jgi:hypothetical protein